MNARFWLAAGLTGLAALLPFSPVHADVVSDFDDGTLQGWTPEPFFGGDLFAGAPGNPGESMQATDSEEGGGPLLARAPASYEGDLSGFLGISWDEFIVDMGSVTRLSTSVWIRGNDGTTFRTDQTLGPLDVWNTKFYEFEASSWILESGAASFEDVIADVEGLFVQMDVQGISGPGIESYVDNVTLVDNPVPTFETSWGRVKTKFE